MSNRQRLHRIDCLAIVRFCLHAMSEAGLSPASLQVVLVGRENMRQLNRTYRRKDYPTDVLSFSYGKLSDEGLQALGDIVIAPEVALLNARRWGIAPDRELRKLLVHGILHLMGCDHEVDRGEMKAFESRVLRRKSLAGGPPLWFPR